MSRRAVAVTVSALLLSGHARAAAQRGAGDGLTVPGDHLTVPGDDALTVHGHADYDWTIRPLGGDPIELEAFRGSVLFINLWASWCTPCIREMETIERLRERLADTDATFLIVAAEEERAVRRHLRRYAHDLPVYLEVDPIPPAFGLRGLPTSWIVDREGRILVLRHGEAVWDTDEVERFIRSLSAVAAIASATPPPPPRTRPRPRRSPRARPARPTAGRRSPATRVRC